MARGDNPIQTVKVTVSLTPQMYALLKKVVATGYSAKSEASAAEELIRKGLNADGLLSELVRTELTTKNESIRK
jgi:hypothetical protein